MSRYRHEYKYRISSCEEEVLRIRVAGLLEPDPHTGPDGAYYIRSLYFDDLTDSCYYENENGTDPRSKFRIRYYNNDSSRLKLEKKSKRHSMTLKESCTITEEQTRKLIEGTVPEAENRAQELLLEEIRQRGLQPRIIVSYERIPYIYNIGNVRVTFDRKITASHEISRFLEGDYQERPILEMGQSVMEVKWDEIMPLFIKDYMQLGRLQWSTFSKYYLARKCNLNGGL